MEPWKITKRSLFWDPLCGPFLKKSECVFVTFFCDVFLTSCLLAFSSQSIHAHQSEAHLGTKLMTFPINVEKWQLRFRSREDIKIKLFRVCISRLFIIFWYVLSKPVIATLHRRHYSHYPQFMDPFGIPFETQICNILHFICLMIFSPNICVQSEISLRHLRHMGNWQAPGGSQTLQEARGLQEAPNHKNWCLSLLECKSFIKMMISHCVFEGQITKYCKLHSEMLSGMLAWSRRQVKAP